MQLETPEIYKSLLDLDDILYIIAKKKEVDLYLKYEKRLTEIYVKSFKKEMQKCISGAAQLVQNRKILDEKIIESLMKLYQAHFDAWSKKKVLADAIDETTKKVYLTARTEAEKKIVKLMGDTPIIKAKVKIEVGTKEDFEAIATLGKQQTFWMKNLFTSRFQHILKEFSRKTVLESGLSNYEAGQKLKSVLSYIYGFEAEPPSGWIQHPDDYFSMLSINVSTVARTHGTLRSYQKYGVTKYQISNPEDERTCPRCSYAADHPFEVKAVVGRLDSLISTTNPDQVKKLHPWLSEKEFVKVPKSKLMEKGLAMPPLHGSCRCAIDVTEDFEVIGE